MEKPLLDFSFLYTLAENDTNYIYEVITLYLNNIPGGLANLEKLVQDNGDFVSIQRQAHSLKSSAGIIKIADVYECLVAIEASAKQPQPDMDLINNRLSAILSNFRLALPLIEAECRKHQP